VSEGKHFNWAYIRRHLMSKPGALLGLLLMLFVSVFNPFGLRDASDRNTETWLQRLFALDYPQTAQDDVVVMLIDDQALLNQGLGWPLAYDEYARLLRRLLSYQPKAVFVDILFSQRRTHSGGTQGLQRVLKSYEQRGVPLFLADYRDDDGRSWVLPEIASQAILAPVNWSGFGNRYPLVLQVRHDGSPFTPAAQLYRVGCGNCTEEDYQTPLLLRWGYWSDPRMGRFVDLEGCGVRGERSGLSEGLRLVLGDLFRAQQDGDSHDRPQRCMYTRTLYADQLSDPRIAEVLRGRYVLLGAHLRGIPDLVTSPVQGQLPGVYSHAMALDNLLSYGSGYWRDAPELFAGVSLTDLLEIALMLAAGAIAWRIPAAPSEAQRWSWCWLRSQYWFWFLLLCAVALLSSAVLAYWMHLAPLDWLGLLAMIGLFYAYLAEPRVANWWQSRIEPANEKQKEEKEC